ncbi:MAG: hypothetical protein R6V75_00795 [Bacteroidales bacterium]
MKLNHLLGLFLCFLLLGLAACEYDTIVPKEIIVPEEVSYNADIAPIFVTVGCTGCHSGGTAPDLRADKSYAALTGGGFVDTGNPEASKLLVKINAGHANSGNITATEKALILKWITEGAKNN